VRLLCESAVVARRRLGPHVATALAQRLADIQAAASAYDLLLWTDGDVLKRGVRYVALDLQDGFKLAVTVGGIQGLVDRDRVDWTIVNRIKIVAVEAA